MGKKRVGVKGRDFMDDSGEEAPCSELTHLVSINDDGGSLSGSPRLSRTDPHSKSKTRGKQPVKAARKKTRAKSSRPKSPTPVSIPEPPPVSPTVSVFHRLYSLGGRPTTLRDRERVRAKYIVPPSICLRVPRKGKHPEHPHSDGVALHIYLSDLGLRLSL